MSNDFRTCRNHGGKVCSIDTEVGEIPEIAPYSAVILHEYQIHPGQRPNLCVVTPAFYPFFPTRGEQPRPPLVTAQYLLDYK